MRSLAKDLSIVKHLEMKICAATHSVAKDALMLDQQEQFLGFDGDF